MRVGGDDAEGDGVAGFEVAVGHVLEGVGEELGGVRALEGIGGALEVDEVVRAEVVEDAAEVGGVPGRGVVAAADDDGVDAARLAGERELSEDLPVLVGEEVLEEEEEERVPGRARVRRWSGESFAHAAG